MDKTKLRKIRKGVLIGTGFVVTGLLGFKLGEQYFEKCMSIGIEYMWEKDPTLKEHMWDATNKYILPELNKK